MADHDSLVRSAAFLFLEKLSEQSGGLLDRRDLVRGFEHEGQRVPLMGPQGIFKPRVLRLPLSITTKPVEEGVPRPYDDGITTDGLILYRYRGTDPLHHENVGLRSAMQQRTPLIYFFGITPGRYIGVWPAYIVGDDPAQLSFTVAADDRVLAVTDVPLVRESDEKHGRTYVTSLIQRRLHQESFRQRVLAAYRDTCAICRLRHRELLDAAHILPDGHPRGEPWVKNGLALCKIHHAAFDAHLIGVRPDRIVEVREAIRREKDGAMLRYGLQEIHERPLLHVPAQSDLQPKREYLEERYELFRKAV